jgi:hypothetical protein
MTTHRHNFQALMPEYIRTGVGVALTAGPVLLADTIAPVAWALGILAVIFAAFAVTVALRQVSVINCTDDGILVSGPVRKSLAWEDLRYARLRYFSTRRDGAKGWMQLVLKGRGVSICIESTLTGFADIVARAAKAANDGGVELSSTTLGNLELLGAGKEVITSSSGSP